MMYILLPVHNRKLITEKFVKCLKKQTLQDFTLVLIDDGSSDDTSFMVKSYLPCSIVIRGSGNLWWAGCLQKGFEWLKRQKVNSSDICLIINDDVVINDDFLSIGHNILSRSPKTLLLAKSYDQKTGECRDCGVHVDWGKLSFSQADSQDLSNCFSTRGLFLKVIDFFHIGGFYPRQLPHYLSDYEFTTRAYNLGYYLRTDSSLTLLANFETTGLHKIKPRDLRSFFHDYLSKRNASHPLYWIVFILLACPWRCKLKNVARVIISSMKTILSVLLKNCRRNSRGQ